MSKGYAIDDGKFGEIMVNVCGWHLMGWLENFYTIESCVCVLSREIEGDAERYRSE